MRWSRLAGILGLATTACGGRFGSGPPLEYRVLAVEVPAGVTADSLAALLRGGTADLALVAATADSAWFSAAARGAQLQLTGPGVAGDLRLGFIGLKPVGDTTVALPLAGGRKLTVFDALYQPQKHRSLDLMLARVDTGMAAHDVAGALVKYFSTDVSQGAALVLGVLAPGNAVADSIASRVRAIFLDVSACGGDSTATPAVRAPIRLFYGPETTIRCDDARLLAGAGTPVYAHFTIGAKP